MAKANTVNAMTVAAQKTGLEDGAAQEQQQQPAAAPGEDIEAYKRRINELLQALAVMALTVQQLQAFDKVWSQPEVAKLGMQEPLSSEFAQRMAKDEGFRKELLERLQELYAN